VRLGDSVAEGAEHALGMVWAPTVRLAQLDLHSAHHAGEEQTALDLRAGDRHLVAQRLQAAAADGEWKPVAPAFDEARAHPPERPGDPAHRPAPQRRVAGQGGREAVAR